jgi:hypothetical protein
MNNAVFYAHTDVVPIELVALTGFQGDGLFIAFWG